MNKDHKIASATTHPPHSNHFQIKEEKDEPNDAIAGKNVEAIRPSNPCASSQSFPPVPVSQLPHFTLNQNGYPPPNQSQSFWMPHQHPRVNGHPFFPSFDPHQYPGVNPNWQPNDHNQVRYTYPPCPGPWDPSSWWGRPPFAYAFPGSYTQVSQMPSSERGIIKPSPKLSQKHQQPWEAQSAENVKLWTKIDHLQSELSDFKSRVVKLEEEISSLKQAKGDTSTGGHLAKRGRPKRSVDAFLPSLDEFRPGTQVRKIREPIFEKVILSKSENNVTPVHLAALAQQGKGKVPNLMAGKGKGLNCSVINGKVADGNAAFAIMTKGMDHRTALASCHAAKNNGSLGWPYAILPPQANGNIIENMNPESVSKEGEKVNGGPGVANEEEDDNDEEMEEDESSSGEEIGC